MKKEIHHFSDHFISDDGVITVRLGSIEKEIPQSLNFNGCPTVTLHRKENGRDYTVRTAYLMLVTFEGRSLDPKCCYIKYLDGNQKNVAWRNLQWCRRDKAPEISKGASRNAGELNPRSRLGITEVKEIKRLLRDGVSQTKIGMLFKVSQKHVSEIASGKMWPGVEIEE